MRYFTKRASMSQINRALQYIEENEEARWVKACKETARAGNALRLRLQVIHCYTDREPVPENLQEKRPQIVQPYTDLVAFR